MQLAELNIGRLVAPTDDPKVAEFMAASGAYEPALEGRIKEVN